MKSKVLIVILSSFGLFGVCSTLLGLIADKKLESYALIAAVGYLASSLGFLFLVGWTFFSGHLEDVEAPKHKVLLAERDEA